MTLVRADPVILTVTMNPSLDRTIELDTVHLGAVNRAIAHHVEPSGKGVNVSRALARNDIPTRAVLPVGGSDGTQLLALLAQEGVAYTEVPVAGGVRVNVSVATSDGVVTKLNEPGARLETEAAELLADVTLKCLERAGWVVLSGSLPPGVSGDFYATLGRRVRAAGARLALDASGDALRAGLGARPDLVKPNRAELAELIGRRLVTVGDVVRAGREVGHATGGCVLSSLGPDGALLVDGPDGVVWQAQALAGSSVRSPVGAGDSVLAGYLSVANARDGDADDRDWRTRALREGITWASVAVRAIGSVGDPVSDTDRARVRVIEPVEFDRVLTSDVAPTTSERGAG